MSKTILEIKCLPPETKAILHHKIYVALQSCLGRRITGDITAPVNYTLNKIVNPYIKMEVRVKVEFDSKTRELNMRFGNDESQYLFETIGF